MNGDSSCHCFQWRCLDLAKLKKIVISNTKQRDPAVCHFCKLQTPLQMCTTLTLTDLLLLRLTWVFSSDKPVIKMILSQNSQGPQTAFHRMPYSSLTCTSQEGVHPFLCKQVSQHHGKKEKYYVIAFKLLYALQYAVQKCTKRGWKIQTKCPLSKKISYLCYKSGLYSMR